MSVNPLAARNLAKPGVVEHGVVGVPDPAGHAAFVGALVGRAVHVPAQQPVVRLKGSCSCP